MVRREHILKWLGQGGMPRCYWLATKCCLPKGQVSRFFNPLLYLLRANVLHTQVLKEQIKIFLFLVEMKHVFFIWKIIFYYFFSSIIYFSCISYVEALDQKQIFRSWLFLGTYFLIFSYVFFSKHSSPFLNHVWLTGWKMDASRKMSQNIFLHGRTVLFNYNLGSFTVTVSSQGSIWMKTLCFLRVHQLLWLIPCCLQHQM